MHSSAATETIANDPEVPLFKRWVVFNLVGGVGILVQLTALEAFSELLEWNYLVATAAAVEVAVLHNFVWHERWTWAERAVGGKAPMLGRLLRFHLTNGGFSIFGNVLLMRLFVGTLDMGNIAANLLAIAICSTVNFFAGDRIVFPPRIQDRGVER